MRYPMLALFALWITASFADVSITERVQINLLRGSSTLQTLPSWDACRARAIELANASTATSGTVTYTCQTERRQVIATYSATPPPPMPTVTLSADQSSVVAGQSVQLSWTSTNAATCTASGGWAGSKPTAGSELSPALMSATSFALSCSGAGGSASASVAVAVTTTPPPSSGVLFTDLASAPSCAMVRQYGFTAGQPVLLATVPAAQAGVPIHQGRCLAADPSTIKSVWADVQPGDVVSLAAGTYTLDAQGRGICDGSWAVDSWCNTFKRGTAAQPIALTAQPGATVVVSQSAGHSPIYFGGNNQQADWITVSGLRIVGRSGAVSGGAVTYTDTFPESGSTHIRIVGNSLEMIDATANTQDGILSAGGDGWKILGNTFVDPANRTVINNNHVIYIQNGADDVEVAWNRIVNLHVGHTIQVHQDGSPMLYERVLIHDNFVHADDPNQMRGFTVSNVQPASTVRFERNHSEGVGWTDWGCVQVMRGTVTIESEECVGAHGGVLLNAFGSSSNIGPGIRVVTVNNSLICPASGYKRVDFQGGALPSELTETNPRACP